MCKYLGYVKIEEGHIEYRFHRIFYSFEPLAEIQDSKIIPLTKKDIIELLPNTSRGINLKYTFDRDETAMEEFFGNRGQKPLFIFNFSKDELYAKTTEDGMTKYSTNILEDIRKKKIYHINKEGFFQIVNEEKSDSFYSNKYIDIKTPSIQKGEKIFIELEDRKFFAGPFAVDYREPYKNSPASFYICPNHEKNKYIVDGIAADGYEVIELNGQRIIKPKQVDPPQKLDILSDDDLIANTVLILKNGNNTSEQTDSDELLNRMKQNKDSFLYGIPEEIFENRAIRLKNLILSLDKNDSLQKEIFTALLERYKDDSSLEKITPDSMQSTERPTGGNNRELDYEDAINDRIQDIEQKLNNKEELLQQAVSEIKEEKQKADQEYQEKNNQLKEIKEELSKFVEIKNLLESKQNIQNEIKSLRDERKILEKETDALETKFDDIIKNHNEKMTELCLNGFIANKMQQAAAKWINNENDKSDEKNVTALNTVHPEKMSPEELIDYLCTMIQSVRPSYNKNTIINIAICLTQGFLTVFSGNPGCGKTSICKIFGKVLGLNSIAKKIKSPHNNGDFLNRFISVSVEKGWTTKEDFIGYHNSLSNTFDKRNRHIYDALRILDREKRDKKCDLPFIILLDEANLSPMEFYWAGFMDICDNLNSESEINLGGDNIFSIPATLRFFATINNDHTTETLSPRLIDRAWIITLPTTLPLSNTPINNIDIPEDKIRIVSWESLKEAFIPKEREDMLSEFNEIQKVYEDINKKLAEIDVRIQPRSDKSIKRYWCVANKYFKDPTLTLDYALAQKLLPKINGYGEDFKKQLETLSETFRKEGLRQSEEIIKDIIKYGEKQMGTYQFFFRG